MRLARSGKPPPGSGFPPYVLEIHDSGNPGAPHRPVPESTGSCSSSCPCGGDSDVHVVQILSIPGIVGLDELLWQSATDMEYLSSILNR